MELDADAYEARRLRLRGSTQTPTGPDACVFEAYARAYEQVPRASLRALFSAESAVMS
jgi:hypothetical protein